MGLHFGLRWYIVTLVFAIAHIVLVSLFAFELNENVAPAVSAFGALSIIALFIMPAFVKNKKATIVCCGINRMSSPNDEEDEIKPGAKYCALAFILLYTISNIIFLFTTRKNSDQLDPTGYNSVQALSLVIGLGTLVIYSIHHIIRPADRFDPLLYLLEINSIEIGTDYLDLISFFSTYIAGDDFGNVTDTMLNMACAGTMLWMASIGFRVVLAFFAASWFDISTEKLEQDLLSKTEDDGPNFLTKQRFALSYKFNKWTQLAALPVELYSIAFRSYVIHTGNETLFADVPFLFKNIISTIKTLSSLALGSKLKQWHGKKSSEMHTTAGKMRGILIFFTLFLIITVISTALVDYAAIVYVNRLYVIATAWSGFWLVAFTVLFVITVHRLRKYSSLSEDVRKQISYAAAFEAAKNAFYKEIRKSALAFTADHQSESDSTKYSRNDDDKDDIALKSLRSQDVNDNPPKFRMLPLHTLFTTLWIYLVTWGAPRFVSAFYFVRNRGSAPDFLSAANVARGLQVFIMALSFCTNYMMRLIRFCFPFSAQAIAPYLQLLSFVMTLEIALDVLSAIDLLGDASSTIPNELRHAMQFAGCLELTSAAFANLWPILLAYWTAIIQLPTSWQRHTIRQRSLYRIPRFIADLVSLTVRCVLLFQYGILTTPVYIAKHVYSIIQVSSLVERQLSTSRPYMSPYVKEAAGSLAASMRA